MTSTSDSAWWQRSVFYHLYVRSFQDSNGDGIGDLPGVLDRLERLVDLGIDVIWLSPFYPSPQADYGYDITDYTGVDPCYGTLADLSILRDAMHAQGLRLVLDFVPNHTSAAHAWFREACRGRRAPRRDWYIFRDPAPDGGPPNNWRSCFGGSAWTLHEPSGQFYLHSFLPEQPDLDWRNPQVAAAMLEAMRFWLDWGADGFRIDALAHVIKDADLRSNPARATYPFPLGHPQYDPDAAQMHLYDRLRPELFDLVVRPMRRLLDRYDERVLIGETAALTPADHGRFLGDGLLHLGIYDPLLGARSLRQVQLLSDDMKAAMPAGAWPALALSSHDVDRHLTRMSATTAPPVAKAAAAALLLSRGTPFVYAGEELGLPSTPIPTAKLRDPLGITAAAHRRGPAAGAGGASPGRDAARTPYQWDDSRNGGFSTGEPWLPVGDCARRNLAQQHGDAASVWCFYRDLISLRRRHPALQLGGCSAQASTPGLWVFARVLGDERLLVVINTNDKPVTYAAPADWPGPLRILLDSTARRLQHHLGREALLEPWEVLVLD